jgi:hypothetical protein
MSNSIDNAKAALATAARDVRSQQRAVDTAAARLAAGGRLWLAGQPGMVSELSGRAGGMMMAKPLDTDASKPGDVVLYFGGTGAPPIAAEVQGTLIAFGKTAPPSAEYLLTPPASDLPDLYTNAVAGWLFTGELIAALIRLGKMPVIYESIGVYSGFARIQQYENGAVPFHSEQPVPAPLMPGELGRRYVDRISAMLTRVGDEQQQNLARAGSWCQEARKRGDKLYMYSMGHLFPALVDDTDLATTFTSATWNAGFRGDPPNHSYQEGEVTVHIGYQHPPSLLLRRAREAGAKVVYVAVRPDRDFRDDEGVIWIDPMWDWPDACVDIEGYDAPLLAASGLVNGAIALEIHERTVA